jgi:hypothetical protein
MEDAATDDVAIPVNESLRVDIHCRFPDEVRCSGAASVVPRHSIGSYSKRVSVRASREKSVDRAIGAVRIQIMNLHGLDLNLLIALDALLAERNVTRAAERIHISQSGMSAALDKLRQHFSDQLLERIGRNMELTARGRALADPVNGGDPSVTPSRPAGRAVRCEIASSPV